MSRPTRWQPSLGLDATGETETRIEYDDASSVRRRRPSISANPDGDTLFTPPPTRPREETPPPSSPRERWMGLMREAGWLHEKPASFLALSEARVRGLEWRAGIVEAGVAGAKASERPQRVQLKWTPLVAGDWTRAAGHVVDAGAEHTLPVDDRVTELPMELIEAIDSAGLRLWPRTPVELVATCTCGGAKVPCDHVIAVHLNLARTIGRTPMALLQLRGADAATLRTLAERIAEERARHAPTAQPSTPTDPLSAPVPLAIDWSLLDAPAPRRPILPAPPGWRALESLDGLVRRLSQAAIAPLDGR